MLFVDKQEGTRRWHFRNLTLSLSMLLICLGYALSRFNVFKVVCLVWLSMHQCAVWALGAGAGVVLVLTSDTGRGREEGWRGGSWHTRGETAPKSHRLNVQVGTPDSVAVEEEAGSPWRRG